MNFLYKFLSNPALFLQNSVSNNCLDTILRFWLNINNQKHL